MQNVQITLPIGTTIRERYVVQALLGKSAFGATYLVRDERVKQTVFNLFVLKEIINLSKQEQHLFSFKLALFRRLDHPALPRIDDGFNEYIEGRAYMLMDYFEGPNLDVVLLQQPKKSFSLPQVMAIMTPLMEAVIYLHSQRPPIIHRDIKPANVILPNASDETVLVDLCIAKEYDTHTITTDIRHGTPGYRAPEQCNGEPTIATDMYALGATFYRLLTGTVPADALDRLTELDNKEPDPLVPVNRITPTVPMAIARAIHRAMSISSMNRFSTVEQFRQALNAYPKVQHSSLLEVTARDYKAMNAHPVVQQATAPIVVPLAPPEPPVVPEQAAVRPVAASVPKQPHVPRLRKIGALLVLLVLLLGLGIGGSLLFSARGHLGSNSVVQTPTLSYKPTPALHTTVPTTYPNFADTYNGTIYNILAQVSTKMSLTEIQQHQGNISGYFTGLQISSTFTGNIDASRHVHFTLVNSAGHATIAFDGAIQSDGNLGGSYCNLNQQGRCSGEYGIWSVGPAPAR